MNYLIKMMTLLIYKEKKKMVDYLLLNNMIDEIVLLVQDIHTQQISHVVFY